MISSFRQIGVELHFSGEGESEKGFVKSVDEKQFLSQVGISVPKSLPKNDTPLVEVDANNFRPTEVDLLIGDPMKSKQVLGWKPQISLDEMVREMVIFDLALFK